MTSHTAEPDPRTFAGDSIGATVKRMFFATRPKFFTASVLPVLVGFAWGFKYTGSFDGAVFILALLATVLVHAASNVYNDVGDDISGTDVNNMARIHPFTGGSRFIQNGVMSRSEMAQLSYLLFGLALLAGGVLVALKGLYVLWMGAAGIALGVLYSMPRIQLIAHGLGELAIVLAFGVLPVNGAAWLFTGTFDLTLFWLSLSVGLWVAAILQINEVPDIAADEAAGKRTLAVRVGARGVAVVYAIMQVLAFGFLGALVASGQFSILLLALPAVLLILAFRATACITPPPHPKLVTGIQITLAIQLLGCLWLVGFLLFMV
ncbi:MAG: prenyltransferase [Gammaproteobacteria bacterium]|nr:prenyltransferase [Gammaproteobacteria bacterium]